MLCDMSLLACCVDHRWATSPNGRGHAGFSIGSLVGKGFGGIGICLPLAGHIPDLGCDTLAVGLKGFES